MADAVIAEPYRAFVVGVVREACLMVAPEIARRKPLTVEERLLRRGWPVFEIENRRAIRLIDMRPSQRGAVGVHRPVSA